MPLPNFFIIGAPKSGSTALYDTITQHPDIYMSPVKEPLFFACDGQPDVTTGPIGSFFKGRAIWQPHDYMALFAGVTTERAIGEASVLYLRSPIAAERIHRNVPNGKLIAILRHPADRAHSHYWFTVQNGIEPAPTFELALEQEEKGERTGWFSEFHHKNNGFYFKQLSPYFALFPREQIKIYLYEDWRENPYSLLRHLFGFLEVDEEFTPEIQRTNITRLPQNRRLNRLAKSPERLESKLRRFLPKPARPLAISALQEYNRRYNSSPAPRINPETRRRLTEDYREDILQLQELIGRDLSHWLIAKE